MIKNIKLNLLDGFSFQIRFYCNKCNKEILENEQTEHKELCLSNIRVGEYNK